MTANMDPLWAAWWGKSLEDIDREIARLAWICQVKILDDGVVERVLRNDPSVCGADNPAAFAKLHNLVVMHFLVRKRAVEEIGQRQATEVEHYVLDRVKALVAAQRPS